MKPLISTKALTIGYGNGKSKKSVLSDLNLTLYPGELTSLIGANGTGKSTLLKTISGGLNRLAGDVFFEERNIDSFNHSELALFRSIVTTERNEIDHLTVINLIALGRFPYTNWHGKLTDKDLSIIEKSISLTGLEKLQNREINTLSDGERQKTFIARALAQSSKVIILDEPTAFLDMPNKIKIMGLLKKIAKEAGIAILISTHDLDLALLLSDRLWLMNESSIQQGVPEDLVLDGAMNLVFQEENFFFDEKGGKFGFKFDNKLHATIEGEETGMTWLKRALERKGYNVNQCKEHEISVNCVRDNGKYAWILNRSGSISQHTTIESLLRSV